MAGERTFLRVPPDGAGKRVRMTHTAEIFYTGLILRDTHGTLAKDTSQHSVTMLFILFMFTVFIKSHLRQVFLKYTMRKRQSMRTLIRRLGRTSLTKMVQLFLPQFKVFVMFI
jgi:hypothetical protein